MVELKLWKKHNFNFTIKNLNSKSTTYHKVRREFPSRISAHILENCYKFKSNCGKLEKTLFSADKKLELKFGTNPHFMYNSKLSKYSVAHSKILNRVSFSAIDADRIENDVRSYIVNCTQNITHNKDASNI